MRKIYLMLLLCFAYLAGSSQTTVSIGSGTGTSSYIPIYYLYDYSYSQTIYSAAELTSGGATSSGMISKLRYKPTATASTVGKWKNWTVFMGNTSQNGYAATSNYIPSSTLTQVFLGDLPDNVTANTWVELTLSTPFLWDGSSNLVITVLDNTLGWGNLPSWAGYTAAPISGALNRGIYFYQDNTPVNPNAPSATSSGVTNSIAQIQLEWTPAGACSGMPSAGTAVAPVTTQCPNTSFNLSLSGTTSASGLTYQWQSRPTSGGAWANISGATTKSYTLASGVPVNTDFRAYVTCTNGGLTDTSTIASVTVSTLAPAGTYTINSAMPTGSGNFQSFTDAANYIKCGIAGPIVFNVAMGSGPYTEQVTFPQIGGSSPTNTITINGNGETLTFSGGTATNPNTLSLDGADYFVFNHLNIEATGGTYGIAAHLYNAADNNKFSNCTFTSSITGTATTQAAFVINGAAASATTAGLSGSGNIVDSCTMVGGYYNTVIYGSSAAPYVVDNQITNSTARDFYYYGIYNVYARNTIIRHNIVERVNRTNPSTGYGIYLSTGSYNCTVDRNRVRSLFDGNLTSTSTAYGLYNGAAGAAGFENKWTNNLVSDIRSKGTIYGMYSASYDYVQVYHNTISLDDAAASGTTTTYGIYAYGTNGVNIKNNIVTISRGGTGTKYCLYLSTSTTTTSDNNVLYMNAAAGTNNIAYRTSAYATLGAWQAATNLDMNSFSVDPLYSSPSTGDYAPTETSIDNKGASLGVLRDILDTIRPLILPDMGAYEFGTMPAACSATPAPGNTVSSVPTACPNGNFTLSLEFPPSELGLTFQWQSADNAAFTTNVVNLGTASTQTTSQTAAKYYRCKVTCTNSGLFAYSNVLFVDMVTAACTDCAYPAIYATSALDEDILNVTVGTMNNTSDCNTTAPDPGSIKNQYSNYTQSVTGPVAERGETVNFSVQVGTCGGSYGNGVQIFIDFNQNGSFNDAGEMVYSQPTAFSGAHTVTGSFAIPMTAALGSTRMRVVAVETSFPTTTNYAQTSYSWGETEDYCFTINAATACAGTPAPGNTVANVAIACPNVPIHLSLQNSSLGSGITYEWQIANDALFTVNVASIGTNNMKDTSQTAAKYYRCKVTCTNSGLFTYSTPIFIDINTVANCYCTPTTTGGTTYYISGLTTTGGSTNIAKTISAGSATGYQNFFTTDEVIINRGDSLAYSINVAGGSNYGFAIWVDFNQDGTFQSSEQVLTTSAYEYPPKTGKFKIPNTAVVGSTRMRVLAAYTPSNPSDPCTNSGSGEYQDYAITIQQPVPVTYTSFTGKKEGSVNLLSWQTATEINNTGFELQRSADNKNFSKLDFIASKANNGNSNAMLSYNYTDAKPLASSNYYRLKQIDRDGKANYSNTILLKGDNVKQVSIVGAYPNPARNILNVQIVAPAQERVSLVVTDITGKILQQETMVLNTGDNIKQIDVSRLTQGTYIIKTICSNGCESAVFKFTKN